MTSSFVQKSLRRLAPVVALAALVFAMGGTWSTSSATAGTPAVSPAAAPAQPPSAPARAGRKEVTGKLNLNTATEDQLLLLPTVGPAKAERVLDWRKKNGGFKRVADLRRVKGFGYRTFKRLEPFLDIKGESTLAAKR